MLEVSIFIVFLAGVASFLSPCVLSLLPAYVGFITNDFEVKNNHNKVFVFKRSLGFVMGFSIVFILMGASVGLIGGFFIPYRRLLMRISGVFIILFGLKMIGVLNLSLLNRELRPRSPKAIRHGGDALLMGMAFGTGWTPCVGPVLASVLLFVGTSTNLIQGLFLLFIYSLGLGIPFLITALAINQFQGIFMRNHKILPIISKVGGVVLVLMGILIYLNKLTALNKYFNFF